VVFTDANGNGFESDNQAVGLNVSVLGTNISPAVGSAVPEPSSLAFIAISMLVTALLARRRLLLEVNPD